MGVNSLLKTYPTASRLRFEPSPTALESSTLTTRLPSHPTVGIVSETMSDVHGYVSLTIA